MVTILYSIMTFWYTVSVSVLDKHVSVIQIMCIRSLYRSLKEWQYINCMCFEVHRVVYQGLCCIWSGEGTGVGEGAEELTIFSDVFSNIYVIDIFTTYWHFKRRGHLAFGLLFNIGKWNILGKESYLLLYISLLNLGSYEGLAYLRMLGDYQKLRWL